MWAWRKHKRSYSQAIQQAAVFISYSPADAQIVHPLGLLIRASGSSPFVDKASLEFGEDWRANVDAAIGECTTMLVFWSEAAAASREVAREYEHALFREKPVVPVLISDSPLPPALAELRGVHLLQMFRDWAAEDEDSARQHAELVKQNPGVRFALKSPWELWAKRIEAAVGVPFHRDEQQDVARQAEQKLIFDVLALQLMRAAKAVAS